MNKLTLIGLEGQKALIIEKLMKLGVVEITDVEQKASDEEWSQLVAKDGDESAVSRIEADLARVKSSIEYLSKYDTRKRGLFEPKLEVDHKSYTNIIENQEKVWAVVDQIGKYDEKLSALRSEENRLRNMIDSLRPWKPLDIPLDELSTRSTTILTGVVPAIADADKLKQELLEKVPETYLEVISSDREQSYLLVIYYSACGEEVMSVLKQYGFSRVTFKDMSGTAEYNIVKAEERIKEIEKERSEIEKDIAALAGEKQNLEILHDYLEIERDKRKVLSKLVRTDKTFMLEGWVPADSAEKVRREITQQGDCIVDIREPGDGEEYPILLKNHPLVQPFEIITELYSLPSSKGIDPNLFMAPFYFLFFGMMVSDAGYGLLMALATGIILLKFKPQGMAYKLIKLIFWLYVKCWG